MFAAPWRIVMPATIFFFLMNISAFAHMGLVHYYLNLFCVQLRNGIVTDESVSCLTLFQIFTLNKSPEVATVLNIYFIKAFSIVSAFLWFMAQLIMIFRIVFVVDFQLIRVTIRNISKKVDHNQHIEKKVEISDWVTFIPIEESVSDHLRNNLSDEQLIRNIDKNDTEMRIRKTD